MTPKKQPFSLKARAINKPAEKDMLENVPALAEGEVGQVREEPIKRLTIDLPQSLHARLKVKAAEEGVTMASLVRELLDGSV